MDKRADDNESGSKQHPALARLQEIANDIGPRFTRQEWEHVRYCPECLEHYLGFVRPSL
jgi:hypothetical protein